MNGLPRILRMLAMTFVCHGERSEKIIVITRSALARRGDPVNVFR